MAVAFKLRALERSEQRPLEKCSGSVPISLFWLKSVLEVAKIPTSLCVSTITAVSLPPPFSRAFTFAILLALRRAWCSLRDTETFLWIPGMEPSTPACLVVGFPSSVQFYGRNMASRGLEATQAFLAV